MTADKDLKKAIRARQEKTGESYTTARLHVLRARDENLDGKSFRKESIAGYVLKCNQTSIRACIPGSRVLEICQGKHIHGVKYKNMQLKSGGALWIGESTSQPIPTFATARHVSGEPV
jgi:hypothetical protein